MDSPGAYTPPGDAGMLGQMETIHGSIYDYPRYYDVVYGSDWKAETAFLRQCFELHSQLQDENGAPRPVQSVFEPACGTGRLLYRLAPGGLRLSGLDLNEKAVEFCNKRLRKIEADGEAFTGDMTDFTLPEPADAAFNTINSFRHLLTDQAAAAHLSCMAAALAPGGLYMLGLHLTPLDCAPSEEEGWSSRRGQLTVNTSMWLKRRDKPNRLEEFYIRFDVYTPTKSFRIDDALSFRTYTAAEMHQLIEGEPRFEIAAVYDFAYDTSEEIDIDGSTEDIVYVLRKKR